jgi:hypothetical protein
MLTDELVDDVDCGLLSTNSIKEVATLNSDSQAVLAEYIANLGKALNVAGCKKAVSFLSENTQATADELFDFMSAKPQKKKYKNELFNALTEDTEIAEKLNGRTEDELTELVTKLLKEHFLR